MEIRELITGKFIDSANHLTPTFWVMQSDSSSNSYPVNSYWLDIYETAEYGDSLTKSGNSDLVTLRRNGHDINYQIDYGCERDVL